MARGGGGAGGLRVGASAPWWYLVAGSGGEGTGLGEVGGDVVAHELPGRLRRSDDGGDLAGQLDEMIQVGGDVLSGGAP